VVVWHRNIGSTDCGGGKASSLPLRIMK